jgi:hypothetical protein
MINSTILSLRRMLSVNISDHLCGNLKHPLLPSYHKPRNCQGLKKAMSAKEKLALRADDLFAEGQLWHHKECPQRGDQV